MMSQQRPGDDLYDVEQMKQREFILWESETGLPICGEKMVSCHSWMAENENSDGRGCI